MVEEELRNLERAGDAEARDRPRRVRRDVLAEKAHAAGLRLQVAGRDVEERGLAGAVRADDREVLAVDDIEIDAVGRDDAAEADDEPGALSTMLPVMTASRPVAASVNPISPAGASRMIAISTPPRIICQASASWAEA